MQPASSPVPATPGLANNNNGIFMIINSAANPYLGSQGWPQRETAARCCSPWPTPKEKGLSFSDLFCPFSFPCGFFFFYCQGKIKKVQLPIGVLGWRAGCLAWLMS